MNTLRIVAIAALLVPLSVTVVLAQTQGELNQRACDAYKSADVELNRVYQRVLSEYKRDSSALISDVSVVLCVSLRTLR
jgi:uncharacterized protein YecT (DUF1311 family)